MAGDIAWGVVVTCLLITLALIFPLVGFCFIPFVPVPTLFYRCKLGRNPSFVLMLTVMAILTVITGRMSFDAMMIVLLLLTGHFLGEQFQKQQSIDEIVLKSSAQVLGAGVVAALGLSLISATSLGDAIRSFVRRNLELTLTLYKDAGVAQQTLDTIAGAQETFELVLVRLLPAVMTTSLLFVHWISILAAQRLFRVKALPFPTIGRLNRWKAPEPLIWVVIACGAAAFLPQAGVRWAGINGLLILASIYFFQGIAIAAFYFDKKKLPGLLRVVLYGMILLQPLVFLVIILLGFFDMWADFRRINRNSNQSSKDE